MVFNIQSSVTLRKYQQFLLTVIHQIFFHWLKTNGKTQILSFLSHLSLALLLICRKKTYKKQHFFISGWKNKKSNSWPFSNIFGQKTNYLFPAQQNPTWFRLRLTHFYPCKLWCQLMIPELMEWIRKRPFLWMIFSDHHFQPLEHKTQDTFCFSQCHSHSLMWS